MSRILLALAASTLLTLPAFAQSLPSDVVGAWDASPRACATTSTSMTRIDIAPTRIDTFGGNAIVREVERQGAVTFAATDFEQTEGAAEVGPRTREHFRFTPTGPNAMQMIWKDVQTVDLVRCGARQVDAGTVPTMPDETPALVSTEPTMGTRLPIPLGLWVVAGESCESPANASWRIYDDAGLRGASSSRCEIDATQQEGGSILFSQLWTATYDGAVRATRDRITVTAPRRFTLVEGDEGAGQDFNWCGPRMEP